MKKFKFSLGLILLSGLIFFNVSGVLETKTSDQNITGLFALKQAFAQTENEPDKWKVTRTPTNSSCTLTRGCDAAGCTGKRSWSGDQYKVTACEKGGDELSCTLNDISCKLTSTNCKECPKCFKLICP